MNYSAPSNERVTAIVSILAAIAILAGGVTAFQSHRAPVDDLVQLESDLRFQLETAFRHDPNERTARFKQLQEVNQAWQASPRSSADREKLSLWLLEATIRSMPGSFEKLPVGPDFGAKPPQPVVVEHTPDIFIEPPLAVEQMLPESHEVPTLAPEPTTNVDVNNVIATAQASEPKHVDVTSIKSTTPFQPILSEVKLVNVKINLTELVARITGYHQGLREIEAKLHSLASEDLAGIAEQVRQLEEIAYDYDFANLYYEILSDRERQTITAPRPLTVTAAQIERWLNRAESAQSGDFLEAIDATNQTLIIELRRRLADIAH